MGLHGGAVVGLLFPGQGSQHVGMGRDLANRFPLARATFEEADDALDLPLSRIAWEGPDAELTTTRNAQPAILIHSVAVHRVIGDGIGEVRLAAGHSLGEFTAYVAAGSLSFRDAVRLVRLRGELMFRSGEERPGGMAAVLGLESDLVEDVCRMAAADAGGACVPANYNAPGQLVISGDTAAVERAMEIAREAGARRVLPLNVSGAFHSPLMAVAEGGLGEALASVRLDPPAFGVVSNVTAEPVSDTETARRLLIEQLTSPVRWTACMRRMTAEGIDRFLELGPGNVLAGLMKRLERDAEVRSIGKAEEVERFLEGGWG